MAEQIRYHLDEHIDDAIARALRQVGINVTTTNEAHLQSASDSSQLQTATADGRVLVTDDADFLKLARDGVEHAGIVYCLRRVRTVGDIIRELISLQRSTTAEQMKGRVVFVTKARESRQ